MFDLSLAKLETCIVHFVGNKHLDESLQLSQDIINQKDGRMMAVLQKYFLSSLKGEETFRFKHAESLAQNEIYHTTYSIFQNPDDMVDQSAAIARHLFDKTDQPNLKGGYLFVCYFTSCYSESKEMDAVGIFKCENAEKFVKTINEMKQIDLQLDEGFPLQKPDKSCLVLNTEAEDGFWVSILDGNKAHESINWRDHFLAIKPAEDSYHFTSNVLKVTKEFVTKEMPDEFPLSKTDTIEILNRSLTYFKENDSFNKEAFAESVFVDERVIDSFKKYDEDYCKYNEIPTADNFEIDSKAVKKQAKIFKSVLKLDKDFHIYIHGNREKIERGTDPDGRKYYKIYFEEEQ